MKQLFTTLLSVSILGSSAMAQLPSISNGGMELWSESTIVTTTPPFTFSYVAPTNFSGLDKALGDISLPLSMAGVTLELKRQIFKSNEKYEGDFAAKLMSRKVADTILDVMPSIMMNAKIEIDLASALGALGGGAADFGSILKVTGGTPILGRQVDSMSVYILAPADNPDNSMVSITAMKMMNIGGVDTLVPIGAGNVLVDPMAGYQHLVIPVEYTDPEVTATDTFRVMVFSSTPSPSAGSMFGATDSNTIYVDKMEIFTSEVPTSIQNINTQDLGFVLYPNPITDDKLYIMNSNQIANATIAIYDMNGKVMHLQEMPSNGLTIDFSRYASGNYFYQINNKDNTARQVGKFVKN